MVIFGKIIKVNAFRFFKHLCLILCRIWIFNINLHRFLCYSTIYIHMFICIHCTAQTNLIICRFNHGKHNKLHVMCTISLLSAAVGRCLVLHRTFINFLRDLVACWPRTVAFASIITHRCKMLAVTLPCATSHKKCLP